jgi:hypothetical protein
VKATGWRLFFIFKLQEEENTTLLLLLPALFAEDCVFSSASGLGCLQVVATPQAPFCGLELAYKPK